ncbi:MAG: RNA polymerase factor sigma-54 [Bellilinea sp.]
MFQLQHPHLRPVTTAHLAQTMTLLNQTVDELYEQIQKELANPALELVEERRCPTCHRVLPSTGSCPVCSHPVSMDAEEPVVFVSPREDFYPSGTGNAENIPDEPLSPMVEDLPTYVLRQIVMDLAPDDRKIAAYLLTHLDDDGFLTIPLVDVARYYHVLPSQVEQVQKIIQRADPLGVGSYNPQEALLVQLDVLSETQNVPGLAEAIVREGMDQLSRHQYPELARALKTTPAKVQEAVKFISENLNPFPGRAHWGDVRQPSASGGDTYYYPDIIISHLNDSPDNQLVVEIILPIHGTLQINQLFRQATRQATEEAKEGMKSDLDRAALFVKCLQQRNHTMQRLMHRVVVLQREYILYGDRYIKPLTRALISTELDVHESTISRAVSNKTVQLPNKRIIPLASFFDRSLNVRTALRELIEDESKPLSDSQLAVKLSAQGYDVARRTVAKYRAMEGILPAHLRRATLTA